VAPPLLHAASAAGAAALLLDAGTLAPGSAADLLAVDLDHLALAGWTQATLAAMLALCAPISVVSDVWVGGVRRVEGGEHRLAAQARSDFLRVAARIP
jgi:cytosine/adenosine deaminase-related metal-dependent hydrolase